jgi:hypothetical protein
MKLGVPHERKEFPGESPDPGIPLSYARTDHLGHLKMHKMKKVHVLFWITPV